MSAFIPYLERWDHRGRWEAVVWMIFGGQSKHPRLVDLGDWDKGTGGRSGTVALYCVPQCGWWLSRGDLACPRYAATKLCDNVCKLVCAHVRQDNPAFGTLASVLSLEEALLSLPNFATGCFRSHL